MDEDDTPHKALPPGLLERANAGDRGGIADAYRQAAAWLKHHKAPPPELCDWLADKLLALSSALRDRGDKKKHDILAAIGAVEAGKRGRKPDSQMQAFLKKMLVHDCVYERRHGEPLCDVFERVAEKHAQGGHYVTADFVAECWKRRRRVAPELGD
jgi:hypothetical protein